MMSVMGKKKLAQNRREEVVTMGYLEDFMEEKDYVTRDYLFEALESQRMLINQDMQQMKSELREDMLHMRDELREDMSHMRDELRNDSYHYMKSLMEDNRHQIRILMEGNNMRFERIERHTGLEPWTA